MENRAQGDSDTMSVCTSKMPFKPTKHFKQRQSERGVTFIEIQGAKKRGNEVRQGAHVLDRVILTSLRH
jgi:hypothetical protein